MWKHESKQSNAEGIASIAPRPLDNQKELEEARTLSEEMTNEEKRKIVEVIIEEQSLTTVKDSKLEELEPPTARDLGHVQEVRPSQLQDAHKHGVEADLHQQMAALQL